MADITVTCTNDKNVSIAFRWDWDNNPFHLLGLDGIYGYDCNVTIISSLRDLICFM